MKKIVALLVLAAGVLPAFGAHAVQEDQTGEIVFAAGGPVIATSARPHRCLITTDPTLEGIFGYTVQVTEGAKFTLQPVAGSTGIHDFDIAFFRSLTPCSEDPDEATYENGEQYDNDDGNESGTVPPFATLAIVTMRVNVPPPGAFVYHEE